MRALLHIVPLLVAGAAGCGGVCSDPCPGALKVEHVMQRVQLGYEPFLHCTAESGLVVAFPEMPNDQAACERHRAEWHRIIGGD